MEAPWTTFIFSSCTVPLMLVAVIMLLTAILVNVHQTKTLTAGIAAQEKEKEPEEHDERFATTVRRRRGSRLSLPCILTTG